MFLSSESRPHWLQLSALAFPEQEDQVKTKSLWPDVSTCLHRAWEIGCKFPLDLVAVL